MLIICHRPPVVLIPLFLTLEQKVIGAYVCCRNPHQPDTRSSGNPIEINQGIIAILVYGNTANARIVIPTQVNFVLVMVKIHDFVLA